MRDAAGSRPPTQQGPRRPGARALPWSESGRDRAEPVPDARQTMSDSKSDLPELVALFRYGVIAEIVRLEPGQKGVGRRRVQDSRQPAHPHRGLDPAGVGPPLPGGRL